MALTTTNAQISYQDGAGISIGIGEPSTVTSPDGSQSFTAHNNPASGADPGAASGGGSYGFNMARASVNVGGSGTIPFVILEY